MEITVSEPILLEIGRITVYQTHIEGQMGLFIRVLLYLDEARGDILTAGLRIIELLEILNALLVNEFGDNHKHVERFKKFRQALEENKRERNKLVHSMWSFGPTFDGDSAMRHKVRRT